MGDGDPARCSCPHGPRRVPTSSCLGAHVELAPRCRLLSAASALGASPAGGRGAAALHLSSRFRAGGREQKLQRLKQPWLGAVARSAAERRGAALPIHPAPLQPAGAVRNPAPVPGQLPWADIPPSAAGSIPKTPGAGPALGGVQLRARTRARQSPGDSCNSHARTPRLSSCSSPACEGFLSCNAFLG